MDWAQYAALYPDGPDESGFERLDWEARRAMERATTGADGVCKLTAAPPTEERAVKAVERCQAALVHLLWQLELRDSYVNQKDGAAGGVVTAITAGSESVSYAAPPALSEQERQGRIDRTMERYLAGTPDGNGVNLLYAGRYPVKVG